MVTGQPFPLVLGLNGGNCKSKKRKRIGSVVKRMIERKEYLEK